MPIFARRPWGQIGWTLERLPGRSWSLLGCLGPEERSLGVWNFLHTKQLSDKSLLVEIAPDASRYQSEHYQQMQLRHAELQSIGQPSEPIGKTTLFASGSEIVALADNFLQVAGKHVILDISSFPKRFFFPFVKRLLASQQIESLIATYTVPESYASGILSEDHLPFAHLPLFGPIGHPEPHVDAVIVGAGFMNLGLAELLEPYKQDVTVRTFLSFPPGMPAFHRSWEFIREMQEILPEGLESPIRVGALDCSDTFQHLLGITNNGAIKAILAPFGPKPMSLAFCLFAAKTKDVVYYTQPTVYNPQYSVGIKKIDGALGTYAYCLRMNGNDLYTIP